MPIAVRKVARNAFVTYIFKVFISGLSVAAP